MMKSNSQPLQKAKNVTVWNATKNTTPTKQNTNIEDLEDIPKKLDEETNSMSSNKTRREVPT